MLLDYVDSFIKSRLQLIKFNYSVKVNDLNYRPIVVYDYDPARDKGSTQYPSISFVRSHVDVRSAYARPSHEVFVPSLTSGVVTSFSRKPYPTPLDIFYEMQTLSTNKEQHNWLTEMMFQVFPPGYITAITNVPDQYAHFMMEKVMGADELSKPVFSSIYILGVFGLWLDRIEHYTSYPVAETDFGITFEE